MEKTREKEKNYFSKQSGKKKDRVKV